MTIKKEHTTIKQLITLLLVAMLLLPSAEKFAHAFSDHKHEVCTSLVEKHIHELDAKCDFYKFNINSAFTFHVFSFEFMSSEENYAIPTLTYLYKSEYNSLHFSLRAPPNFS